MEGGTKMRPSPVLGSAPWEHVSGGLGSQQSLLIVPLVTGTPIVIPC